MEGEGGKKADQRWVEMNSSRGSLEYMSSMQPELLDESKRSQFSFQAQRYYSVLAGGILIAPSHKQPLLDHKSDKAVKRQKYRNPEGLWNQHKS